MKEYIAALAGNWTQNANLAFCTYNHYVMHTSFLAYVLSHNFFFFFIVIAALSVVAKILCMVNFEVRKCSILQIVVHLSLLKYLISYKFIFQNIYDFVQAVITWGVNWIVIVICKNQNKNFLNMGSGEVLSHWSLMLIKWSF